MSVIRILPEHVANKIAAGEVVERPASVAKELLENSLDAGARQISIHVESGGKRLIRVDDDGCGMGHDDAISAFERHATSKIRSADDLDEIATLGFRGEALPSIAAVSRLTLETRLATDDSGTRIEINGGRMRDRKETARPPGTTIEVASLFYNTPARRKFLRSESTELGHIASLATHYALAHPDKAFSLTSVSNEILKVSPVASHRERLYQVMGGQLLDQLVEFGPVERQLPAFGSPTEQAELGSEESAAETEPADTNEDAYRIFGFASRPEVHKLNRNNIYFFVNRRLIRDRLVLHALTEAYRNILPAGIFPVALLFLEMPAAHVDVNVHPSKAEVRFRNGSFVHDLIRDVILQKLMAARPIASFAAAQPKPAAQFAPAAAPQYGNKPAPTEAAPPFRVDQRIEMAQLGASEGFRLGPPRPQPWAGSLALNLDASTTFAAAQAHEAVAPAEAPAISANKPGSGELASDLRPLGQIQSSFIVATNSEGLWIVDQHVAHERILFERHLRTREENRVETQRLLLPIVIDLGPEQRVLFDRIAQELAGNGIDAEPFGPRSIAVKAAPADIAPEDVEKLIREILDEMGREARALSLDELRAGIAASVACHAAIKINMPLDQEKMEWLLAELGRTKCPMTCPHGRPVVLRYSMKEIQKAFKRI